VHVKHLANSLALEYNFYSPNYNFCELAEDYGWKEFSVLSYVFARGLAKAKCGGI
jgi:hypothetical protein